MQISKISFMFPKTNEKQESVTTKPEITFQGSTEKKAAVAAGTILAVSVLGACNGAKEAKAPETTTDQQSSISQIILVNTDFNSLPISEFYLTNIIGQQKLYPNEDLPRNDKGTIIITVSKEATEKEDVSGNT